MTQFIITAFDVSDNVKVYCKLENPGKFNSYSWFSGRLVTEDEIKRIRYIKKDEATIFTDETDVIDCLKVINADLLLWPANNRWIINWGIEIA